MKRKLEDANDDDVRCGVVFGYCKLSAQNGKGEKKLKTAPLRALHLAFHRSPSGGLPGGKVRVDVTWIDAPNATFPWESGTEGKAWGMTFDPEYAPGVSAQVNEQQMSILDKFFSGHAISRIVQSYALRPYGCNAWVVYSHSKKMVVIRGLLLDRLEAESEWRSWYDFHSGVIDHGGVQHVFAGMTMVTIPEFSA